MNFYSNITHLGLRYFRLKTKPQLFSQRALMRALGYSESGASYISWRNGTVPAGDRLEALCDRISVLLLHKEQISLSITKNDLLFDSLESIIDNAKQLALVNLAETMASQDLNTREKNIIALIRLLDKHPEYDVLVEMLETTIKLISLQVDESLTSDERHHQAFNTLRNILLEWIKPQINL